MAFIYETPIDLCSAIGTAYQYFAGKSSERDPSSLEKLQKEANNAGTVVMAAGVAMLILGVAGCYACYSGRLGRLGIPCAVIGIPLTIAGWDAIQIGRFMYHSADPEHIQNDPVVYAVFHDQEDIGALDISEKDYKEGTKLKNEDDEAFFKHVVATVTANSIAARFLVLLYCGV